jgi:hypothetical protein
MPSGKQHVTDNNNQPLTTSDGSYVVIEAEIDPADLTLATPGTPMFQAGGKRFTRGGKRATSGFTGPYRS